jgi:hypothetical protein
MHYEENKKKRTTLSHKPANMSSASQHDPKACRHNAPSPLHPYSTSKQTISQLIASQLQNLADSSANWGCEECAILPGIGHKYNYSLVPRPAAALECCGCGTLHKTTVDAYTCGNLDCRKPFCDDCLWVGRRSAFWSSGVAEAAQRWRQGQNLLSEAQLESLFLVRNSQNNNQRL